MLLTTLSGRPNLAKMVRSASIVASIVVVAIGPTTSGTWNEAVFPLKDGKSARILCYGLMGHTPPTTIILRTLFQRKSRFFERNMAQGLEFHWLPLVAIQLGLKAAPWIGSYPWLFCVQCSLKKLVTCPAANLRLGTECLQSYRQHCRVREAWIEHLP